MKFNIISGAAFILMMGLNVALVHAADGREDAHCSAIFLAATEHFQANADQIHDTLEDTFRAAKQLDLHKSLFQMFEWERARTGINLDAYLHQSEFYYDKLDTATALLHYDRCYWRGVNIYKEYRKSRVPN